MTNNRTPAFVFWYVTVVSFGLLFLVIFIVRYFGGPMIYALDPGVYSFTSFYFSQNVSWLPLPHLALQTNWSFYPHGINHVFLHWCLERDLFSTLLTRFFGQGPWFQIYFLISTSVSAYGVFYLLRRDVGPLRASFAGFAVSFLNFYAIEKYPIHQPYSCIHWTVLAMTVDYVLLRRFFLHRRLDLPVILLRLLLTVLSLGLDLGYVAGLSLTSLVLTAAFITIALLARSRNEGFLIRQYFAGLASWGHSEVLGNKKMLVILLLLLVTATWLYVPLTLDIYLAARSFDFSGIPSYYQWENPLRLLMPLLPKLNPWTLRAPLTRVLGDMTEDRGFHFSPGLALVLLGAFSLVRGSRRHLLVVLPFLILFVLCVTFHPIRCPTLKFFPWFGMARIPGRTTLVFPLIFVFFSFGLPAFQWSKTRTRILFAAFVVLLVTETLSAYEYIIDLRKVFPNFQPTPNFYNAMDEIHSAPGEALFEWPFMVAPTSQNLGLYYGRLGGSFQLAPFHHKKGMGFYLGRLHPEETKRIQAYGWPYLIFPNNAGPSQRRQRRDFVQAEWRFLEDYVKYNDFAGVLLYVDLLPETTVTGFHKRFGKPTASFSLYPEIGKVQFIPKASEWHSQTDVQRGKSLRLVRPIFPLTLGQRLNLSQTQSNDYLFDGWSFPAQETRWTVAPHAVIRFSLKEPRDLILKMALGSFGPQEVTIRLNGTLLGVLHPNVDDLETIELPVTRESLLKNNELELDISNPILQIGYMGPAQIGVRVAWIELEEKTHQSQ